MHTVRLRPVAAVAWLAIWMLVLIAVVAVTGRVSFWIGTTLIVVTGVITYFLVRYGQLLAARRR